MFIVEQAHWFYEVRRGRGEREKTSVVSSTLSRPFSTSSLCCPIIFQDFCRDQDPALRSLSLKQFATTLLSHCPPSLLPAYAAGGQSSGQGGVSAVVEALSAAFSAFKATVPTAGLIILDPTLTKVLLVRGLKEGASWGFPKGKLAKGESDLECALREGLEETGFDAVDSVASASDFIELHDKQQRTRLFIAPGVGEDTPFAPLVRGEIGGLAWHLLADLPSDRDTASLVYTTADGVRHRFFRVWPYVRPLKRWIKSYRARVKAADGVVPAVTVAAAATPGGGGKKARGRKGKATKGSGADDEARQAAAPAVSAGHLTVVEGGGGGGADGVWAGCWPGFQIERIRAVL